MQNIRISLMDEKNNILEESEINFAPVLKVLSSVPSYEERFPFLSGIDPYGNTYFNFHQTIKLISDLKNLIEVKFAGVVRGEIEIVIGFLEKVEQHTFVKFIGD